MAIISILAALLLPALRSARESANRVLCINNTRQIGLAANVYRSDYGTYIIQNNGLAGTALLLPYCSYNLLYTSQAKQACPGMYWPGGATTSSIMVNKDLWGDSPWMYGGVNCYHDASAVKNPSTTFLLCHGYPDLLAVSGSAFDQLMTLDQGDGLHLPRTGRSAGSGNTIFFVDGHIEFMRYKGGLISGSGVQSDWYLPQTGPADTTWQDNIRIIGPW